jgi:hypothetical protein
MLGILRLLPEQQQEFIFSVWLQIIRGKTQHRVKYLLLRTLETKTIVAVVRVLQPQVLLRPVNNTVFEQNSFRLKILVMLFRQDGQTLLS